ncbi:MAG: glycosyltransferase family A protein, partial [Acidimicrobiia bacterium]
AGVALSRGRYIIPLDSDDELAPSFMATMLQALESKPAAAFAHCYARLFHDIDAIWITRPFNPYWQLLGNGIVGCVVIRRAAFDAVRGYDETMTLGNEDWELWVRLHAQGWDQVQVGEVLFKYRKHGISMSVETEGRFELGRRQIRDRHPNLFATKSLRSLKATHYPLITVVSKTFSTSDPEIEVVPTDTDLSTTWGKYVTLASDGQALASQDLISMADLLETHPRIRSVQVPGVNPVHMVRRWNLHDPDAPATRDVDMGGNPIESTSDLELCPRSGWSLPEGLEPNVDVQRQPPEEAGRLPEPANW